jgi:hypothetical protein
MSHQTALDWLMDQLDDKDVIHPLILWKAKEMEKEQIIEAYVESVSDEGIKTIHARSNAEQYYNDTFVGD